MFRKKTIQRWKKYIGNLFRIPTNGNSYELILPNGKVKRYPRIPGLKVAFHGVNSKVRIYAPARFGRINSYELILPNGKVKRYP